MACYHGVQYGMHAIFQPEVATLHAINRAPMLGVNVACNTTKASDARPSGLATDLP